MPRVAEKRWLILVVMLGLVAGLLGVDDQRAVATHGTDPDVDFEATYSACVGAATDPAGFEDTAGSFAEDAINCLAHFGVTQGRTPTTYAPNDSVLRWQMALFLARAAGPAGIVLENPATDQGFTDVGGLSDSARNAINGLAAAGIMPGATAATFTPNQPVTRASMAMLIDAFLREARPGTGAFGSEASKYSEVVSDSNAVFNDLTGVSILEFNAIGRIYELGITRGVGDHQFGPQGFVTRAQMAAFITRALAHTVARPAGVSVQISQDTVKGAGSSTELLISVRDAAFEPLADATVDVFSSADAPAAFASDGSCATGKVTGVIGAFACQVDRNDEVTDITGDITDLTLDNISAATTVWAWTGEVGDKYGSETDASSATVGFVKAPAKVLVSDDLKSDQQLLSLGQTIKFTLQVADEDDNPATEPGWRIPITISETTGAGATTGSSSTHLTDDQGRVELSFTKTGTSAPGETAKVTLQIGASAAVSDDVAVKPGVSGNLPVVDMTTNKVETVGDDAGKYVARWSEEASEPTTLTISPNNPFTLASDTGRGAVNMVTATLTDQYGAGVRGARIAFRSDDQNGVGGAGDGLNVTISREAPPRGGFNVHAIALEVSPAFITTGTSEVEFTITARRTSGVSVGYDLPINYAIDLPYGVTATPEALSGVLVIPRDYVSGSVVHPSMTLSVPEDAVGLSIFIGRVGALPTGPPITVGRTQVDIVEGEGGETVHSDIVSQGGVLKIVPCQFPRLVGSDLLPGGVTPVRCLTGEPRNNNYRTTNRSGKAIFSYSRDDDSGGLETIWASYLLRDTGDITESLLSDRLYHPWAEETDGNVSGQILVADADNDQAVILSGSGYAPQLVKYDSNDQLSSLDGLDIYANFDKHMGRVEGERLPGYMTVGSYSGTASGVSQISLYGRSTYQPPRHIAEAMDDKAAIAVSGNGVVVIGVPDRNAAYVYSGLGDRTPQTLTLNNRTVSEIDDNGLSGSGGNIRTRVRATTASSFGTDVAISDDGNTIVVGDPQRNHPDRQLTAVHHGAAYVYTRGSGGQYQLAALLSNDYYFHQDNPYHGSNFKSLNFGAGVDISGDGNTIAVASPGGGYKPPHPGMIGHACHPSSGNDCEVGYIHVYPKPDGGWRDDHGFYRAASAELVPQTSSTLGTPIYPNDIDLGKYRSVSVSYDGSVVSAGAPLTYILYPDPNNPGDTIEREESGGVFVWERPDDGWSTSEPTVYNALLGLTFEDSEDFGWIGGGARLSADGSTVVFSGNHPEAGDPKAELYVFRKPATGWAISVTYQTLSLPDLQNRGSATYTINGVEVQRQFIPSQAAFGQWVDVSWDGSEVITNRHLQSLGDYRGGVVVFARSADGSWEPAGGFLGDAGSGFGRYAAVGGDDSVVGADQFGGKVTWISRPR